MEVSWRMEKLSGINPPLNSSVIIVLCSHLIRIVRLYIYDGFLFLLGYFFYKHLFICIVHLCSLNKNNQNVIFSCHSEPKQICEKRPVSVPSKSLKV